MIFDLLFIAAAIIVIILIYKFKFSQENLQKEIKIATLKEQEKSREKQEIKEENTGGNLTQPTSSWVNDEQEQQGSQDEQGPVDIKKKMRKQQKLKEKQERKEAHEWFLKEEKQKREKLDKQNIEIERLQEEKRLKEEAIVAQLKEQERKRKEEEFNKWKDMFSVESEGKQKLSEDQQKRKQQAFNNQLIGLLRQRKLLLLEDLSHKFKLSTKEIVEKIKQLESKSLISGIFDERGKYLVVQDSEWRAIKNYISARGRVKKTDIMKECAKLIKIPDEVEEDLFDLIKSEEKADKA